jgi:hypothetical protein
MVEGSNNGDHRLLRVELLFFLRIQRARSSWPRSDRWPSCWLYVHRMLSLVVWWL